MPLVVVNAAFEKVTGHDASSVLGYNCRFLQGPQTEADALESIMKALRSHTPCDVTITNYHKSGKTFSNILSLRFVFDAASGRPRIVVATLHQPAAAKLTEADAIAKRDGLLQAIPKRVLFSTAAPELPAVPPTDYLQKSAPPAGTFYWVGAPIRKHITALKALLRLKGTAVRDGQALFVDFLSSHWRRLGRISADGDTGAGNDLDIRLALHSDNLMRSSLDYIKYVISFWTEVERCTPGGGINAYSGEDRATKVVELFVNVVKAERGPRGQGRRPLAGGPTNVARMFARSSLQGGGQGSAGSLPGLAGPGGSMSAGLGNSANASLNAAMRERGHDSGSEAGDGGASDGGASDKADGSRPQSPTGSIGGGSCAGGSVAEGSIAGSGSCAGSEARRGSTRSGGGEGSVIGAGAEASNTTRPCLHTCSLTGLACARAAGRALSASAARLTLLARVVQPD
eukprot:6224103-Prymnesium_polylepis.2